MSLKKQALSGIVWSSTQIFGNQFIGFGVSMILARLLTPAEFGTLAMIYVFTGIAGVLVSSGLGTSLIRTKDVDDKDYSTVFVYNFFLSLFFYLLFFFIAPFISSFYKQPVLVEIIRVYCLILLINSLSMVQIIRLQKTLNFKIETIASLLSNIVSGLTGVYLAYNNFGVMSLVWMGIVGALIKTSYIWFNSNWRPSFNFNKEKFKKHFKFGLNLTFTGLLDVFVDNMYNIYIGKFYSAAQLGFYSRADSLKQLPVGNVLGIIGKVTYPLFASVSHDTDRLRNAYKQVMMMIAALMVPVMLFAGILAKPLVIVLFSEKWLPSVPYFQILCIVAIFYPLRIFNTNIFLVKGRSDLYLKLELFKKIFFVVIFVIAMRFGIYGLIWGQVIYNMLSFVIESFFAGPFIKYTFMEQLRDLMPVFIIGVISAACAYYFYNWLLIYQLNNLVYLFSTTLFGTSIFILLVFLFNRETLQIVINFIKR